MTRNQKINQNILLSDNPQPSQVSEILWIFTENKDETYPESTERNGKWLIFLSRSEIDAWWEKIKSATEQGLLGDLAKVSTTQPSPKSRNPNQHVICVYTYDWTDEEDVRRIRQALRELGVTWKIPYKAVQQTIEGKLAVRGDKRISKYYE